MWVFSYSLTHSLTHSEIWYRKICNLCYIEHLTYMKLDTITFHSLYTDNSGPTKLNILRESFYILPIKDSLPKLFTSFAKMACYTTVCSTCKTFMSLICLNLV